MFRYTVVALLTLPAQSLGEGGEIGVKRSGMPP